jgi:hypothetical protein
MKIKCKCGKLAVWVLMSSDDEIGYCDDCVPRGCSCNFNPVIDDPNHPDFNKKENWIEERDELGRLIPCCEYWYKEEGWVIE